MAKADQDWRMAGEFCAPADEIRQRRVLALLAEGKVNEPEAQECAALNPGTDLSPNRFPTVPDLKG